MPANPINKRQFGLEKEALAARFLQSKGVRILQRNFQCKLGEIDLIGQHGKFLVFIEVRYRTNIIFGSPLETVDKFKQAKLIRSARFYLAMIDGSVHLPCRFDVVGIVKGDHEISHEIEWVRNAFEA